MTAVIPVGNSKRTLLLDANVMLLLCVGLWDRSRISKFKRTRIFTDEDFDLLSQLVAGYGTVVTTPHVLSEVSNHADFHGEPERSAFFAWLADLYPGFLSILSRRRNS